MTMLTKTFTVLFFIIASFILTPAWSASHTPDAAHGKILVEKKCMSCHDNRQYTRPNRIIHTFEDLRGRVEFCDGASNANFSVNDIDDVVKFLNINYYKFKK